MGQIEGMEPYEIDSEDATRAEAAIEQADRDLAEETRVNMRWSRAQLEVVKRAAALFGIPYQTYVKQAAFRAALDDLVKVREAGKREGAA